MERFVQERERESYLSGLLCTLSNLVLEHQQSTLFPAVNVAFNELSQPDSQKAIHSEFIIISDRFCIALFSALEQTHCAHVTCDSE